MGSVGRTETRLEECGRNENRPLSNRDTHVHDVREIT